MKIIITVFLWASIGFTLAETDIEIQKLREEGLSKGWTFKIGLTPISGMPLHQITGLKEDPHWQEGATFWQPEERLDLPRKWDWRDKNVITEVRDQAKPQYCGSCWAFGTIAAFESAILIHDGPRALHLSEQQLVSCPPDFGSCGGGDFSFAFYKSKGANYNDDFPYQAKDVPCNTLAKQNEKVTSWGYVGNKDRAPSTYEIKSAIYKYGAVAVTVSASGAWSSYKGGVYNECNSNGTNHIVALVGWDEDDQVWILKNSHGTEWGEAGYMRIKYTGSSGGKCNNVGLRAAYVVYKP